MLYKKLSLGSLFILLSGILYEIDKILSYYKWVSFVSSINGMGGYSNKPDDVSLFDNVFVVLFLVIGFIYYISAIISVHRNINNNLN